MKAYKGNGGEVPLILDMGWQILNLFLNSAQADRVNILVS